MKIETRKMCVSLLTVALGAMILLAPVKTDNG